MGNENESSQLLDKFLFPKVFQTFRMAIQPTKLMIALSAVAIICLAGWLMDFSKTVVKSSRHGVTELEIYAGSPDQLQDYLQAYRGDGQSTGVFSTLWNFGAERFHQALHSLFRFDIPGVAINIAACFKALLWALKYHYIYSIIFFAIVLAVMSIAGGAICRIAALQFSRGEKPGLTEALRFSAKKFLSFFSAPLTPVGIIIFVGVFIFLLGLVGNIPWAGELIIGVFLLLALLAGGLITAVLIGAVAGFNLMFPTIAYEDSDCFDAISRSFSYVYAKPWRMGFYTAIAVVYGAISYIFVRLFAFLLLWVSYRFLALGVFDANKKLTAIWPEPNFADFLGSTSPTVGNWAESIAAFLVCLIVLAVVGLLVSFVISFYFSANTIIYALMRNRVDNIALEDVYKAPEKTQTKPSQADSEPEQEPEPSQSDSASSEQ